VAGQEQFLAQERTAISTNFRHNEQIRIPRIFLIDENEVKVGEVPTIEALRKARELGMDLVEVAPTARPPVCKIMDYGKWRYQQQKKADKSRAHVRGGQLKEIKFRTVKIGDHDLGIKIKHAREFLEEGNKVQFTLQFRGREMAHQDLGRQIFNRIKAELFPVSKVERDCKMEGKRMILVLQPENKADKVAPGAPVPGATAMGGARPQVGTPARPAASGSGLNIPMPARSPAAAAATAAAPAPAPAGAAAPAGTPR
jgi:translation initiation factor IF-3